MALRPVIIYRPAPAGPIYTLEHTDDVARAIRAGAEQYTSHAPTVRYVLPGASHADAWRHTLAESTIGD